MYIAEAFKYRHEFWRYILGTLLVITGVIIGQIPLAVAIFLSGGMEVMGMEEAQIMQVLEPNLNLFLMLLTFAVGLVAVFLAAKFLHGQSLTSLTTSRKKIDWSRVLFAFGLVAGLTIISSVVDFYVNPDDYVVNFKPIPFLILFLIAIVMIPLQTSFEEYFFRGYLLQGIGIFAGNRWLPLIITSVVFGGLHFFNPEVTQMGNIIMVYYIGTGFMLGIMTLMDEGLELALGFHAANNLVAVLLVTAEWTAFQSHSFLKDISEPTTGWDVLVPVFVIYPALLFIMSKKYGWKNWRHKLFGKVEKPETLKLSEKA